MTEQQLVKRESAKAQKILKEKGKTIKYDVVYEGEVIFTSRPYTKVLTHAILNADPTKKVPVHYVKQGDKPERDAEQLSLKGEILPLYVHPATAKETIEMPATKTPTKAKAKGKAKAKAPAKKAPAKKAPAKAATNGSAAGRKAKYPKDAIVKIDKRKYPKSESGRVELLGVRAGTRRYEFLNHICTKTDGKPLSEARRFTDGADMGLWCFEFLGGQIGVLSLLDPQTKKAMKVEAPA